MCRWLRASFLSIATVLGVVLLTLPIGMRLYKAAGTAFMMAPALLGIALIHTQSWEGIADASRFSDDWLARIISLIVLFSCAVYLNIGKTIAAFNPPINGLDPASNWGSIRAIRRRFSAIIDACRIHLRISGFGYHRNPITNLFPDDVLL